MAVFDIFSKRQRLQNGETPEVYVYDTIPDELRVQILYALSDAVEFICDITVPMYRAAGTEGEDCFAQACLILHRELGKIPLCQFKSQSSGTKKQKLREEFLAFFQYCEKDHFLDCIEVVMYIIKEAEREQLLSGECNASTVASEMNTRFKEHGVGYQYESGQIIVLTNSVLHSEAVKPALTLLWDPDFEGANEEYLKAHGHYKEGRYSECLVDCSKAFESTMKIICDLNRWDYKANSSASNLIKACLDNNLIPTFSQEQLTALRMLFKSGVPTIRNKQAAHGQGGDQHEVPQYLAQYALHLTAANIVLLVQAHKNLQ